jgi:TolA-binding protein
VSPVPNIPARPSPLAAPEPEDEEPAFSRIVWAALGQTVEIPFQGAGWVFLGELNSRRGLPYVGRRLDAEGLTLIFRVDEPGIFELKFYKQDYVRDYILNDYVRVIAEEVPEQEMFAFPADRGRVVAEPRWPSLLGDEAAQAPTAPSGTTASPGAASSTAASSGTAPTTASLGTAPTAAPGVAASQGAGGGLLPGRAGAADDGIVPVGPPRAAVPDGTAPSQTASSAEGLDLPLGTAPEEYLRRARETYEAGRIPQALAVLDQFRERFPAGSDEAWWLYGQSLEAAGPSRDIRSALDYYRRLVQGYPQSTRFDEARRRIAYLERYYFNIP